MNYRFVCNGCPFFGGDSLNCEKYPEQYKDWTYIFYKQLVTRYPHVTGIYGTSKCWKVEEAKKISKQATGSENNFSYYIAAV